MPGVGKSTLAARYGAAHSATVVIDIDTLHGELVANRELTREDSRRAGLDLIGTRLRERADVVVPQLVARADQLDRFEAVARDAHADFVHVLVTGRTERGTSPDYVDGLSHVAASRTVHAVLETTHGDEAATLVSLEAVLAGLSVAPETDGPT